MALDRVERLDLSSGELAATGHTQAGGLVVKAKFTRTGVFDYAMPDGSTRRELRPADEVLSPEALATFPHATVTIGHPGRVTTANWKEHAVGHVADVARDGEFAAGHLLLQDGDTIADAKAGKLRELSCGYSCDIDPTPGEHQGEPYDVVQRNHRINHVGMGPKGWGRMGPEVRMHLDSGCAVGGLDDHDRYVSDMTDAEKAALAKAEKDAADAAKALEAANKVVQDAKDDAAKVAAQLTKDRAEMAELRAKNALLELQAVRQTEDAAAKQSAVAVEKLVQDTIAVRSIAAKVFGDDWKHDGKDVAAIKREVIAGIEKGYDLALVQDAGALDAVFAMATKRVETVGGASKELFDALSRPKITKDGAPGEEGEGSPIAKAAKKIADKRRDGWKDKKSRRDRRHDVGTKGEGK